MPNNGRAARPADKAAHLLSQAERARKMAAQCGSIMVADLFEVHAQMCERNARSLQSRKLKLRLVEPTIGPS
jgi:hypothetical protein